MIYRLWKKPRHFLLNIKRHTLDEHIFVLFSTRHWTYFSIYCVSCIKHFMNTLWKKKKSCYVTSSQQLTTGLKLMCPFLPLRSILVWSVTISGWRCRLEWHGCSWGMPGIPLVNTSFSDSPHTLISLCPWPPFNHFDDQLIITNDPSAFSLSCCLCVGMCTDTTKNCCRSFTRGTILYIIHSDTPQWLHTGCSNVTVHSQTAFKCQQLEKDWLYLSLSKDQAVSS